MYVQMCVCVCVCACVRVCVCSEALQQSFDSTLFDEDELLVE